MFTGIEKYKTAILIGFIVLLFVGLIVSYFYIGNVKKSLLSEISELNQKLQDMYET